MPGMSRAILVLGARNLGGAVLDHYLSLGWSGAAVARSGDTLEAVKGRGALALEADASDPGGLADAIERARSELGGLDLIVNAVSAARPPAGGGAFGGGPIAEATLEGYRGWGGAVGEQAFVFLNAGAKALRASGGGTLIQVTGGSARRAMPGRGIWASGTAALRALTHAAAQELREEGIHVALLIVDATIESPKTADFTRGAAPDSLADQAEIARAVEYLAGQSARGLTHELTLTPAGDRWLP
jgi:NAD(P)-dependent dehydrogenase (short-subunit alcohol dehydrogenase family)